jgi:hypothetical protein
MCNSESLKHLFLSDDEEDGLSGWMGREAKEVVGAPECTSPILSAQTGTKHRATFMSTFLGYLILLFD